MFSEKKLHKQSIISLTALSFLSVVFLAPHVTHAAAWWGKGARKPEWVLDHGGSIFNYQVVGDKAKKYKAMMFRDGKYVEVEFDQDATFDDAKDGWYEIIFYKCKDSCIPHMTDDKKKIRSSDKIQTRITLEARPGETVNLVFDANAKRVFIKNRYGYIPPKTPEQIAMERAEAVAGIACAVRPQYARSANFEAKTLPRFTSPYRFDTCTK